MSDVGDKRGPFDDVTWDEGPPGAMSPRELALHLSTARSHMMCRPPDSWPALCLGGRLIDGPQALLALIVQLDPSTPVSATPHCARQTVLALWEADDAP